MCMTPRLVLGLFLYLFYWTVNFWWAGPSGIFAPHTTLQAFTIIRMIRTAFDNALCQIVFDNWILLMEEDWDFIVKKAKGQRPWDLPEIAWYAAWAPLSSISLTFPQFTITVGTHMYFWQRKLRQSGQLCEKQFSVSNYLPRIHEIQLGVSYPKLNFFW